MQAVMRRAVYTMEVAMSKGRNTRVVAIRITDVVYTMLEKRAKKKGLSVSDYIKWDLTRKH